MLDALVGNVVLAVAGAAAVVLVVVVLDALTGDLALVVAGAEVVIVVVGAGAAIDMLTTPIAQPMDALAGGAIIGGVIGLAMVVAVDVALLDVPAGVVAMARAVAVVVAVAGSSVYALLVRINATNG
ncbi:hypothetical protein LXA47_05270 [Massilia sp. P8910]|uniref:hypothetical protein n=1 Tax=Massilia antarctica TaxID=2765360 RepID=UPI001E6433A2|nr:hypothetical protein [Massilia antarctica]MCE3603013.1 hypothetical protein [Massilia antarctica]